MIHSLLKKLVLWHLIAIMAGLPLPWVHRHCDVPAEKLANHMACFHASASTVSLGGWHIHLIGAAVPPKYGVNHMEDPLSSSWSTIPYVFEDSKLDEVDRGTTTGQRAVEIVSETRPADCKGDAICRPLRLATQRRLHQLLCIWQI